MSPFQYLCRFQTEKGEDFFAKCASFKPTIGSSVDSYSTYKDLVNNKNANTATIAKVGCRFSPTDIGFRG